MYSFSIKLPGNKKSVEHFDRFCDHCLQLLDFPKHRKILFAIHEAIINAVEIHEEAFTEGDNENIISVDILANPEEIIVKVIDCGAGISKEQVHEYTEISLDHPFNDRGRGILFMEKFTDQLRFEHLANGKFCVSLHFLK